MSAQSNTNTVSKKVRSPAKPLSIRMEEAQLTNTLAFRELSIEELAQAQIQAQEQVQTFIDSVKSAKVQITNLRIAIKQNALKAKVMTAYNKKVQIALKNAQKKAEKKARIALSKEEKKARRIAKKQEIATKKAEEDGLLNKMIEENRLLKAQIDALRQIAVVEVQPAVQVVPQTQESPVIAQVQTPAQAPVEVQEVQIAPVVVEETPMNERQKELERMRIEGDLLQEQLVRESKATVVVVPKRRVITKRQ